MKNYAKIENGQWTLIHRPNWFEDLEGAPGSPITDATLLTMGIYPVSYNYPNYDVLTQKIEMQDVSMWTLVDDQLVIEYDIIDKTPAEIEDERRIRRLEERTAPDALIKMMEVVAKATIAQQLANLGDEDIAKVAVMFPDWEVGMTWTPDQVTNIAVINYEGELYKIEQAHTSQADWLPPDTPALYTPYRNPASGPEPWVQPTGAQDAYNIPERVTHDNPNDGGNIWIYESAIDANTTEPGRDGTFDRWWTPISVVV